MKSDKILGILLIAAAFWAGAQKNVTWGLLSFLPFFVLGVALLTRNKWQKKN